MIQHMSIHDKTTHIVKEYEYVLVVVMIAVDSFYPSS